MSNLVHKIKDAVTSDKDKHHEQPTGTHGHHDSRAANAADPRIDSDRDGRANPATGTTGTSGLTGTHGATGTTGTSGLTGTSGTTAGVGGLDNRGPAGPASRTDGPHSSNLANKADPRVDSDRDHSRNMGANPSGTASTGNYTTTGSTHTGVGSTGLTGNTGTTGGYTAGTTGSSGLTGVGGTTGSGGLGATGGPASRTDGPHSSNLANKADPRVDSDRDYSRNMGANPSGTASTGNYSSTGATGTSGLTGTHGTHGTTGTSGLAGTTNTSGTSGLPPSHGAHGTHGATGTSGLSGTGANLGSGPGPAANTAGPHKSDMLNKADPRVDSDLDGSKTVGADKTYAQSNTLQGKDPTDAAQVPPSVLRKSIGEPEIAHDDHSHARDARHSISHQEEHRGL